MSNDTACLPVDCVVVPFSHPAADVQLYVYHGQVTLKMTWSENYKNPESAAYKELYNNIYSEVSHIIGLYACRRLLGVCFIRG